MGCRPARRFPLTISDCEPGCRTAEPGTSPRTSTAPRSCPTAPIAADDACCADGLPALRPGDRGRSCSCRNLLGAPGYAAEHEEGRDRKDGEHEQAVCRAQWDIARLYADLERIGCE